MFELLKKIRLNLCISAILTFIIGIILIIAPGAAVSFIFSLLGWILIISGVLSLMASGIGRGRPVGQGDFILGVIQLAAGLVIVVRPGFLMSMLGIVVGFVLLLHGIHDIQSANEAKTIGYPYKLPLVIGFLTALLGFATMLNPFSFVSNVIRLYGIFLVVDGLTDLLLIRIPRR